MKKTVLSLYMNDSSKESLFSLLQFYRFAIFNGVDDIVLLTRDILEGSDKKESLKKFLNFIPELDNCRTHILLSSGDTRTLSADDIDEALGERRDVDLIAGSRLIMGFEGRRINCFNGFDGKYLSAVDVDDLNDIIYEQDPDVDVTIVASSKYGGFSKKYLQDKHFVMFAKPLKAAYLEKDFSTPLVGFSANGITEVQLNELVSEDYEKYKDNKNISLTKDKPKFPRGR